MICLFCAKGKMVSVSGGPTDGRTQLIKVTASLIKKYLSLSMVASSVLASSIKSPLPPPQQLPQLSSYIYHTLSQHVASSKTVATAIILYHTFNQHVATSTTVATAIILYNTRLVNTLFLHNSWHSYHPIPNA